MDAALGVHDDEAAARAAHCPPVESIDDDGALLGRLADLGYVDA